MRNLNAHRTAKGSRNTPERAQARPVYVISIAAEITGLHPRTLRIYEARGLLAPVRRNRIRLYSDQDIERVKVIRQLIQLHRLNLAGVRLILEVYERLHYRNDDANAVDWLVERILEGRTGGEK